MAPVEIKTATDFLSACGNVNPWEEISLPAVDIEDGKRCLDQYSKLPQPERIALLEDERLKSNAPFFSKAYHFSQLEGAIGMAAQTLRSLPTDIEEMASEELRSDIREKLLAQKMILRPLRQLMATGESKLLEKSHLIYSDDPYQGLAVIWRDIYLYAPCLFDSDGDGAYDATCRTGDSPADQLPTDALFMKDSDGDGVPNAFDAAPEDREKFFDPTKLPPQSSENPYDVLIGDDGRAVISLKTFLSMSKDLNTDTIEDSHNWARELGDFFDLSMDQDLNKTVIIRPEFTTDPTKPHHRTVLVKSQDEESGDSSTATAWRSDARTSTRAHETGHLLGWEDRYHMSPFAKESSSYKYDRTFQPGMITGTIPNDLMAIDTDRSVIDSGDIRRSVALATSAAFEYAGYIADSDSHPKILEQLEDAHGEKLVVTLQSLLTNSERLLRDLSALKRLSNLDPLEAKQIDIAIERDISNMGDDLRHDCRLRAFHSASEAISVMQKAISFFGELRIKFPPFSEKLNREIELSKKLLVGIERAASLDPKPKEGAKWIKFLAREGIAGDPLKFEEMIAIAKRRWLAYEGGFFQLESAVTTAPSEAGSDPLPIVELSFKVGSRKGKSKLISIDFDPMSSDENSARRGSSLSRRVKKIYYRDSEYRHNDSPKIGSIEGGTITNIERDGGFFAKASTAIAIGQFELKPALELAQFRDQLSIGIGLSAQYPLNERLSAGLSFYASDGSKLSARIYTSFDISELLFLDSEIAMPITTKIPELRLGIGVKF